MTLEQLQAEFPNWSIEQEAHRYSARIPHWGAVYGQDLEELEQRLKKVREFHDSYPRGM